MKLQDLQGKQKELANKFVSEKDSDKKAKLKPELIAHHKKVKAQEENVKKAEFEYERAMHREPVDLDEVTVSEEVFTKMILYFLHERFWTVIRWGRMMVIIRRNTRKTRNSISRFIIKR